MERISIEEKLRADSIDCSLLEAARAVKRFTFIEWQGNDSTRLQKIFKDFFRIAEFKTGKLKELWLTDDTYVLKHLRSRSSVRSATHKHRDVWEAFQLKYPTIERVNDYYRLHAGSVAIRVYTPLGSELTGKATLISERGIN